jgi:phosphatidylglycerol:prolipoprotein diacylglycerol transferase
MQHNQQVVFSGIDLIAFEWGALSVRWFSLLAMVGFVIALVLTFRRLPRTQWSRAQVTDLLFWCAIGAFVGGRIGYVVLYQFSFFISHPLAIFNIIEGGLSFHTSLLGGLCVMRWRARKMATSWLATADFFAPILPICIASFHIGHLINAELWGRVSSAPWAVVFPDAGPIPRHPSQLYEFVLEGLGLFVILWLYSANERRTGAVCGLFFLAYGIARFCVEFFREPDPHIGLLAFGLSMGQILSLPMLVFGGYLIQRSRSLGVSEGARKIPR